MRRSVGRVLVALVPYGLVVLAVAVLAVPLSDRLRHETTGSALVFRDRGALVLLLAGALLAWVGFHLHLRRAPTFAFSRVGDLARTRRGIVAWLSTLPAVLRVVAVGLIAVALARPQTFRREEIQVEGIDIMLVLDVSKSMEEDDLERNRIDAAQRTIRRFLRGRKNDRIGLVAFAKDATLECPLTLDYRVLDTVVSGIGIGDLDPMGTAIGDGLALAVGSLRRSDAKSKVVILLTDGDSNVAREFGPDQAKELARTAGVRVFTVLIGREDGAVARDGFGRQPYAVNPALLRQIAADTGGRYFNAPDTRALDRGFEEVRATLELSKRREVGKVYGEVFPVLAAPALLLLLLELALSLTRFRRFP